MNILDTIYNKAKDQKLSAYNQVYHSGVCMCVNFIEVDNTTPKTDVDTTIMTLSIMLDRKKKNALGTDNFRKLMTLVESGLNNLSGCEEYPYFVPLWGIAQKKWYTNIKCHRVFLLPTSYVFPVIEAIFNTSNISLMNNELGLKEISVILRTNSHDAHIQFFG